MLLDRRHDLERQERDLAEAKAHVERNRILNLEGINGSGELNAVPKSLVSQLERHRTLRVA
jgi:hypothetical protein